MCVKFPPRDLNPGPCHQHPTNTYTCGVTIAPRARGGLGYWLRIHFRKVLTSLLWEIKKKKLLKY